MYSVTNTDSGNVEVLAVKEPGGPTVVMVSDHAVANANDNNGAGSPRTVLVDTSALGSFTTAKQLTITQIQTWQTARNSKQSHMLRRCR